MSSGEEKIDLKRLREGDRASFRRLYLKHHEKVYFYCFKLIGNRQAAEEITEDAFVALWLKRATIDPEIGISGLLFKITKDYAWNHLKKMGRRQHLEQQFFQHSSMASAAKIESDLILEDYLTIAEKGIQLLPEKCRRTFNLKHKKGLNDREIAQQLRVSEVTVRVQLYKAKRFLRNYLKTHPEIPFSLFWLWACLPL